MDREEDRQIQVIFSYCTGPVASAVSNRFSARTSVMLGTMMLVSGLITSGFAQSVSHLIATYGILQGRLITIVMCNFL